MKFYSTSLVLGLTGACAATLLISGCDNRQVTTDTSATSATVPGTTVGTEIDDSVVTARVKSALLADQDVKSFDIKVETRKGQVQLSGFVDTQNRIDNAIAIAGRVQGVKGVENGMAIKDGQKTVGNAVDDSILTTQVKSALLADPSIKSLDIAVATRKGTVQLSGYVDSQTQISRALSIARTVDGVQSVDNEMSVKK